MDSNDIIKARKVLNMTQDQLSKELGWSAQSSQLSHIETGKKQATQQTQLAIECLLRQHNKLNEYLKLISQA